MRIAVARRYVDFTRVRVQYVMIVWAGFFFGEFVYFNTHRLGLFLGPLGFLKFAAIGGHLPRIDPPVWFTVPFAAVCALAFLLEQSRSVKETGAALFLRLGLASSAIWSMVATWLHYGPQSRGVWNLMKLAPLAVATLLLAGVWPRWRRSRRFTAMVVLSICAAVDLLRNYLFDQWRLGAL